MKKYMLVASAGMLILFAVTGCGKNALLSALPEAASSTSGATIIPASVFADDFNAYVVGPFSTGTSGWTVSSGAFSIASIDGILFASASRSLCLDQIDSSKGGVQVSHSFAPATVLYAEFNCQTTSVTGWGFEAGPTVGGTFPVYVEILNGEIVLFYITYSTPSSKSWTGTNTGFMVSPNTWYKINLRVDVSAKTWLLLVNGVTPPGASSGTFNADGTLTGLIDGIKFKSGSGNCTYYADDIKVTR